MSGFAVIQTNYPNFDIVSVHDTWDAAIEARGFGQWVEPIPVCMEELHKRIREAGQST